MLKGEFVIKRNGKIEKYSEFEKIPSQYEHLIQFKPEYPPEPHTEEQHEEIGLWNARLQQLMEIEREKHASSL